MADQTQSKPATADSQGFKLPLPSPVTSLTDEDVEMQETARQDPPPTAATQQSSIMDERDSGLFSFDRPGSRAGASSYFAGSGSRLNTGIGISYDQLPPGTGMRGRPLTSMAIPEESALDLSQPLSAAAALAAAYRDGRAIPQTAATNRRSLGTPVIELAEHMRYAAEREGRMDSETSSPDTGKTEADTITSKKSQQKDSDPYENMDPEELLKMADQMDFLNGHGDRLPGDEEDSPFAEVRASVSNFDDPDIPCLTFRALFLGIMFTCCGAAANTYFNVRYPAPLVTPMTIQVLSYPCGVLLARILPVREYTTPTFLTKVGMARNWSLNPGPFNIKEHTVIIIMANVGIAPALAVNTVLAIKKHFGVPTTYVFDVLALLSTQAIGFSFAGLCRRFLVWPAALIWPQTLVTCTLLNTFHAEDDDGSDGSLTRYRYFLYLFCAAALWYFVPGFLFVGLSAFSWVCWIAPRNLVVNQLFGVMSGLGMSCLTFDWSQISYIGSPLVAPWWSIANVVVGFVLIYWILVPALYYTNTWGSAYLPISLNGVFDRYGESYNVSRILTPQITFDAAAYRDYSPMYFPSTYVMFYLFAFALTTSVLVHTALHHGPTMWKTFRNIKAAQTDIHAKLMLAYREVPAWWYALTMLAFAAMSIALVEVYKTELPLWGVLLSLVLPAVYLIPSGFIYALANQQTSVNVISELIIGYILPGKPIANLIFKTFSAQPLQNGLYFVQDLKLGHYMKIPPRTTFTVQILAVILAAFIQAGMIEGLDRAVADFCTAGQAQNLSCPATRTIFNAAIIWGAIGPSRLFGAGSPYRGLLWGLLAGAVAPIPFWYLAKRYKSATLEKINTPVLFSAILLIPPASGINFSSWGFVGFVFQFLLRRYRFRWWSKFNFITSAAMDSGTVIGIILVFLILQLPKGGVSLNWWGNTVFTNTLDAVGMPYLTPPASGFGRTFWS